MKTLPLHSVFLISSTILLAAISSSVFYHTLNILELQKARPYLVRDGISVVTADDTWYMQPPLNWLQGKGWQNDTAGIQSYFQHSPGYGLVWLVMISLAGEQNALLFLIAFQIFLHAVASVMMWLMLRRHVQPWIALAAAFFFAIWPGIGGFLNYTLTEGITPALLLFYVFALWRFVRNNQLAMGYVWLGCATLLFAFLFITRPVLGIFLLMLPVSIVFKQKKSLATKMTLLALTGLLALTPALLWQYRNYRIAGEITGLHPFYFPTEPGIYRPAHESIWRLCKSWAMHPPSFHQMAHSLFDSAMEGDTSLQLRHNALELIPQRARQTLGDSLLLHGFALYQQNSLEQGVITQNQTIAMPREIPEKEKKTIAHFNKLTKQYRQNNRADTYLFAPLRVLNYMIFHSNLNLYAFQHPWRGKLWMEGLRLIGFAFHVLLFLSILPALLIFRKYPFQLSLALSCLLYIMYLAWIQRGIEERYTLPILPLLFFNGVHLVDVPIKYIGNSVPWLRRWL